MSAMPEPAINQVFYSDHNGIEAVTASASELIGVQYFIEHKSESGGYITTIEFQNGNPADVGINGATNEVMLAILIHRLTLQNAKCPSAYNVKAIECMVQALAALGERVIDRQNRGVTGTQTP